MYPQITVKHNVIHNNKFEEETFVAYYSSEASEMGNDGLIAIAIQHEIDHFSGTLIIDSDIKAEPIVRSEAKVGRNDSCPCGSKKANGNPKKYKHCCGA